MPAHLLRATATNKKLTAQAPHPHLPIARGNIDMVGLQLLAIQSFRSRKSRFIIKPFRKQTAKAIGDVLNNDNWRQRRTQALDKAGECLCPPSGCSQRNKFHCL